MSEYREQTAHSSVGDIVTLAGVIRNDPGGDLSTGNLNRVALQCGPDGGLKILGEGANPTWFWSFPDIALAATPTDVFTLFGSATKTIKIVRAEVYISGATGAAAVADVQALKRTTVNTGGTSTAATVVGADSADGASTVATATGLYYTANPSTLGTSAGAFRIAKAAYATPGATVGNGAVSSFLWNFNEMGAGSKLPTLRGTSQGFCINLNGSTLGGTSTASILVVAMELPNTV